MDEAANQRSLPWLLGLIAVAVVVGGALALGIGNSDPDVAGELPGAPVQGMADPNAPALPVVEDDLEGRPVLQVTTGEATSEPTPTTAVPAPSSTSTTAPVVSSDAPETSAAPIVVDSTTTTAVTSESTTSSTADPSAQSTTTAAGASTSTTAPATTGGLNAVELELARLTNELRTNPNGLLRREGPVINCEGRVPVDPATGLYEPVAALTIDETASIQVAREWSAQLTTNLQHRPQAGIEALQGAGLDVAAAGENIAYHNFPDTAMRHFVGWRESDGHFCNMMDPTFTHIGVGEITRTDGFSFATQNFFSFR
ncbi:MAG: CAP domain-containing protein [Actinomycetota bacterium]